VIYHLQTFLQRRQLIPDKHLRRFHRIPEPAGVGRDSPHHLRRYAVIAEQIVAAGFLDVKEIVFRRHLTERQDLDPVRLAVLRLHEQVTEVTQPFRVTHRLAHPVNVAASFT